jgi:hypothetical protein
MRNVVQMPGIPTSVKAFATVLRDEAEQIQNLACVVLWKNGKSEVYHVQMTLAEAAWLDYIFRRDFMSQMEPR